MNQDNMPGDELPETRDSRSPRSRARQIAESKKDALHRRSVSQSSHRSASPATERSTHSRANGDELEPEGLGSRRASKSSGPRLNTWDVPEFLPGALPRANPVQRAFFEERSKKVFLNNLAMDALEAQEARERMEAEEIVKVESDIKTLRELFPSVEIDLIQETYFGLDGKVEEAISQLLIVSDPTLSANSNAVSSKGPPSSDDEREYPSLVASSKRILEKIASDIEMTIVEADPLPNNPKDS